MSLINCPECAKEFSSLAPSCIAGGPPCITVGLPLPSSVEGTSDFEKAERA